MRILFAKCVVQLFVARWAKWNDILWVFVSESVIRNMVKVGKSRFSARSATMLVMLYLSLKGLPMPRLGVFRVGVDPGSSEFLAKS